jgi:hypothetical protein
MFHFVYKTTKSTTNEYYIGVHSSKFLEDDYYGSGTLISRFVEKHGVNLLNREILEFFDTREEAFAREAEIVTQDLIDSDPLCLNIIPGGLGGWSQGLTRQEWLRKKRPYLGYARI